MSTKERIELSAKILSLIELRRIETGDPALGCNIERMVLETQLRDIEEEILANPGALEFALLRRDRRP
jgi:hypothetical protein